MSETNTEKPWVDLSSSIFDEAVAEWIVVGVDIVILVLLL
jgi:hypothetical protein